MAEAKPGLRKPVFTKVDQLRPGTNGHTLTVKIVSSKMVLQKGRADGPQVRQMRIAECLVGDETGMIVFTARNDQGTHNCRRIITVVIYDDLAALLKPFFFLCSSLMHLIIIPYIVH